MQTSRTKLTISPLRRPEAHTETQQHRQKRQERRPRGSAGRRRVATDRCCGSDARRAKMSALLRARPRSRLPRRRSRGLLRSTVCSRALQPATAPARNCGLGSGGGVGPRVHDLHSVPSHLGSRPTQSLRPRRVRLVIGLVSSLVYK